MWTSTQILLVWLVSFGRMVMFLTSNEGDNPALTVESFILDVFYWSLMIICLGVIWTVHYKSLDTVWFMNQLMFLKKPEGK